MGIMLVYDITNPKSFNNVTNWLRNIDEHASEDVVRVLVGNKVATKHTTVDKIAKDVGEMLKILPHFKSRIWR